MGIFFTEIEFPVFSEQKWNQIDLQNTKGGIFFFFFRFLGGSCCSFSLDFIQNISHGKQSNKWLCLVSFLLYNFKRSDIYEAIFHELTELVIEWTWISSIIKDPLHHRSSKLVDRKPWNTGFRFILCNFWSLLWS